MAGSERKVSEKTRELSMNKILSILSLFIFLSACTSTPEESANNNTANSNMIVSNPISTESDTTISPNANSQLKPLEGVDPNIFNKDTADIKTVNRDTSNLTSPLTSRPAPENSEFQAKGLPDGSFAETRTFKNHPQLSKIEKITNGKNISMKVYLKNGKSYPFTEEQIPNFRVADSQNILLAIGLKPISAAAPTRKNSETKGEKDTEVQ